MSQAFSALILAVLVGVSWCDSIVVIDTVRKSQDSTYTYSNQYHDSAYRSINARLEGISNKYDEESNGRSDYEHQNLMVNKSTRNATWTAAWFAVFAFGISFLVLIVSTKERRHELMAYVYPKTVEFRGISDRTNLIVRQKDSFGMRFNDPLHRIVEVWVTFKNTGQTPAFNFSHMGGCFPQLNRYAAVKGCVKWWRGPGTVPFQSEAIIPPNQEVTVVFLSKAFKGMREAALINGINHIFAEGMIKYNTLGRRIDSRYRFVRMNSRISVGAGSGIEVEKGSSIYVCEKGNSTEDRSKVWIDFKRAVFKVFGKSYLPVK